MGIVVEALTSFIAFGGIVSTPGMYASGIENPYVFPATTSGDRLKIDAGIGTHFSDIPWWYGFVSLPSFRFLGSSFVGYAGIEGSATSFREYGSMGEETNQRVFIDSVVSAGAVTNIRDSVKIGVKASAGIQKTRRYAFSLRGSLGILYTGRSLPFEAGLGVSDLGIDRFSGFGVSLFGRYRVLKELEVRAGGEFSYTGSEAKPITLNEAVLSAGWKGNGAGISFGGLGTGVFIFARPVKFISDKLPEVFIRGSYSFIAGVFDLFLGVGYSI